MNIINRLIPKMLLLSIIQGIIVRFHYPKNPSTLQIRCEEKFCPEGTQHVGCDVNKTENLVYAKSCGPGSHKLMLVNGDNRETLLQYVNMYRNFVASGLFNMSAAARMTTVTWDMDLVKAAVALVHRCNETLCVNSKKYNFVATVVLSGTLDNFRRIAHELTKVFIPLWLKDLSGCRMDKFNHIHPNIPGTCTGHYVPLIQDRGNRMGCAIRLTRNKDVSKLTMICNLSRANVNDMPPYVVGEVPGQNCRKGPNPIYGYLCHPKEKVDANYVQPPKTEEKHSE